MVIADPSYFPDKVRKIGRVARAIVIMNHPLPLTKGTAESGGSMSAQIIVPANQIMPAGSKKNDIYVGSVSQAHNVSAKGHWIAFVSTILESDSSDPEAELALGLQLCGAIEEKFVAVDDMMVPLEDGSKDNVFLSESYDATSHFETTFDDIASLYERCMGKPLGALSRPSFARRAGLPNHRRIALTGLCALRPPADARVHQPRPPTLADLAAFLEARQHAPGLSVAASCPQPAVPLTTAARAACRPSRSDGCRGRRCGRRGWRGAVSPSGGRRTL